MKNAPSAGQSLTEEASVSPRRGAASFNGIPDPEFNPYHRTVFAFLACRDRLRPAGPSQRSEHSLPY